MQKLKASLAQVQPLDKPPAQHHTIPLQSRKPSILGPRNECLSVASSHVGVCSTFIIPFFLQEGEDKIEEPAEGGGEASSSKDGCQVPRGFFRAPIK